MTDRTGYFVFSLDTEMAWGYFDKDELRARLFSPDGTREREAIQRLLAIFEEFEITATWAVVGHLFYPCCQECEQCPVLEWEGKYSSFEAAYRTEEPLWYGADVMDLLLRAGQRHEIGFHGYTHAIFDECSMPPERAQIEIEGWLKAARPHGLVPRSVVFPRNTIGHLDLFQEAGFECYRGQQPVPPVFTWGAAGRLLKTLGHLLPFTSAAPCVPALEASGLVNLPASEYFFGFNRRAEALLDACRLHNLRIRRMANGVKQAARHRQALHIWAHPQDFRKARDFEKLRYLLAHVADEVSRGRMRSVSMAQLAKIVREQKAAEHESFAVVK